MLPEPFIAMLLIASLVMIAGCLLAVGTLAFRQMRRLEAGMETVLEATQESGRGIKGLSQNVGKIARYSEASVEFQRKVHDHQRVLLTSLNKQMRHLETMLAPSQAEAEAFPSAARVSTSPAGGRQRARLQQARDEGLQRREEEKEAPAAKPQPVPFHELFAAASRSAANPPSAGAAVAQPRKIEGSEKAIMLARLFKDGKFSGVTTADGLDQVMDEASRDRKVPDVAPPVANAAKANGIMAENRFGEELRKVGNG